MLKKTLILGHKYFFIANDYTYRASRPILLQKDISPYTLGMYRELLFIIDNYPGLSPLGWQSGSYALLCPRARNFTDSSTAF